MGKETQPTLCINDPKLRSGVEDLRQNKHQLLHRIASVKTPLIYNCMSVKRTQFVSVCACQREGVRVCVLVRERDIVCMRDRWINRQMDR